MPRFYEIAPGGVRLTCRVTPNAKATAIDGAMTRDDGTCVLRIRVTAPPDRGRANTAIIALLAKAVGVPKSAITLMAGATGRQKTLTIDGDPQALAAALDTL